MASKTLEEVREMLRVRARERDHSELQHQRSLFLGAIRAHGEVEARRFISVLGAKRMQMYAEALAQQVKGVRLNRSPVRWLEQAIERAQRADNMFSIRVSEAVPPNSALLIGANGSTALIKNIK